MPWGKYGRVEILFCFNRKRSEKKIDKDGNERSVAISYKTTYW